ncbi:MAG: hypothetical protein AAF401_00280 [Pseudomonadota bacterium]
MFPHPTSNTVAVIASSLTILASPYSARQTFERRWRSGALLDSLVAGGQRNAGMDLYFRIKDNGATVYRINDQTRQRRLELQPIAEANVRNGDIKPRKDTELTEAETKRVKAWLRERRALLADREIDAARQTIDHLNATANWYSSKPDESAAEEMSEELLLAMHDLRAAIVRFKSKMLGKKDD